MVLRIKPRLPARKARSLITVFALWLLSYYFSFVVVIFEPHVAVFITGLFLPLHLGITLGSAHGTICDARIKFINALPTVLFLLLFHILMPFSLAFCFCWHFSSRGVQPSGPELANFCISAGYQHLSP